MSIQSEVQVRSGTTTEWADTDPSDGTEAPVLGLGEVGVNTTTGEVSIGDGATAFAALAKHKPVRVTTLTALVAGTKTVTDAAITATALILPVLKALGTITVPKAVACTARTAGVSYVITSADATDTSIYQVLIIEP